MKLTKEHFESCNLDVYQASKGHRYGRESIDLANYCEIKSGDRVVEFGAGVGVISLMLAAKTNLETITAIEVQYSLFEILEKNVEANGLIHKVICHNGDLRDFASFKTNFESYDLVLSNPPFFKVGEGKISSDPQRAGARHELHGDMKTFLMAAHSILKPKGKFCVVFNIKRKEELIECAAESGFELLDVSDSKSKDAFLSTFLKK